MRATGASALWEGHPTMPDNDRGQEPNGWELLRAIKGIESRFDNFTQNYVPLAVFSTLVERVKVTEGEIDSERANRERALDTEKQAREAGDAALRKEMDDQRKTKAQQWFSIGLLGVGAVITLLVSIFRQGVGMP